MMDYQIQKFNSGMHYFTVEDTVIKQFLIGENKRIICKLADNVKFHCAFMKTKEGTYFINIGSKIMKQAELSFGSIVSPVFEWDTSDYQFEFPPEFAEVLEQDEEANAVFQALSKGNQRGLIYLITQVKSIDKKIARAIEIAEKLKRGITSPKKILKP